MKEVPRSREADEVRSDLVRREPDGDDAIYEIGRRSMNTAQSISS